LQKRILALDYGEKRIGIAVSDPLGITAQPVDYMKNEGKNKNLLKIKELILKYDAKKIVVGVPLTLSGGESKKTKEVNKFIEFLRKNLSIEVDGFNEAMTTRDAQSVLLEGNVSRKKRKEKIDKLAASLILQQYLRDQ